MRWSLAVAACAVFASGCGATAQSATDGAVAGRVLLSDGRADAFAQVELVSADGSASRVKMRTPVRDDGSFIFLKLEPGTYQVRVSDARVFGLSASADVDVEPGNVNHVELHVAQGGPASQNSAATQASSSRQLSTEKIAELPFGESQWERTSQLFEQGGDASSAAASPNEERDGSADSAEASRRGGAQGGFVSSSSGLSFAGLPSTQNAHSMDGLSATQNFRSGPRGAAAGGPVSGSSFGQSAVRSFRVLPRTYSAQYGNAAGAVLAVSSRTASQQMHGGAFYLVRTSAFDAANPFSVVSRYQNGSVSTSVVKPQDTLNQLGIHVSLPLLATHGRTATSKPTIFASLEQQQRANPAVSTPESASFYSLTATQTALLRNRGVNAAAQNAALTFIDSLSGPVDRSSSRTLLFLRADSSIARHDRVELSYALNRFNSPSGTGFDQSSDAVVARGRSSVGDQNIHVDALSGRWLHTFSPHANHEVRGQWAHDLESEQPRTPLAQEPAISPGGFAPQVSIEPDGFSYGTPSGLGRRAFPDEHRVQVADAMQFAFGHHLLLLGGDWSRIDDRITQLNNAAGTFLYDSGTTNGRAGGLVDWITDYTFNVNAYPNGGCPSINSAVHLFCFRSFTQSFGGEQTQFVTHDIAGYTEDVFRLAPSLQVSVGARYEYTLLPLPQTPNSALDAVFANIAGPIHASTSSFPEDRNNIGPRVSVAWSPAGGRFGTVHVGYGMFFGRLTGATVRAALANTALPATTTQIRITPATETTCPQVANQGFGYPCAYVAAPPAAVAQTSSATLFASNFRLPAVQRGTLLVERGIGKHVLLRAEYAASIATQLAGSLDLNIAPATAARSFVLQGGNGYVGLQTGQTFTLPFYTARRVQQYGPVTALVSNANATYHAATLEATLRGVHALELRGAFTYSRSIDYAPQVSATPRLNGQLDPFSNGYDKGLSSLNYPIRFAGAAVYRAELKQGPLALRRAVSGWRIAATAFASSGAPYSYTIFGGTRLSGGRESLNGSGGATYLPTVGRNTLRLPARGSVDLRLGREFVVATKLHVNVFAETFNLLNKRNLARVETRAFLIGTPASNAAPTPLVFQDAAAVLAEGLTTRPFGTPTSSTTSLSRERQAELGVRLTF